MAEWLEPKKILVILAHPDDPEFFCGGSISKWIREGNEVHYALMTKGEKGINDTFFDAANIVATRIKEQRAAADVLGVKSITYMDFEDGMITPDLSARRSVISIIRKIRPNIVVTCDPTNYYMNDNYINHPDHRAAGQIVVDAVFPGAGNELYFPELVEKGFAAHQVEEVWISLPKDANIIVDVTDTWPMKVGALEKHASQIGDVTAFRAYMDDKNVGEKNKKQYEERFHRIIFRK